MSDAIVPLIDACVFGARVPEQDNMVVGMGVVAHCGRITFCGPACMDEVSRQWFEPIQDEQ